MRIIYADEIFIENAVIDYVLLIVTAKLTAVPIKRPLAALAALLGGAYAVAVSIAAGVLVTAVFKVAAGALMAFIVFGKSEHFLRTALVFFAVSAAFAGAVMAFCAASGGDALRGMLYGGVSFKVLILSFLACWLLFSIVFKNLAKNRVADRIIPVVICLGGRTVTVPALIDTGNALYDPVSGSPVTVCSLDAAEGLLDGETLSVLRSCRDPVDAMRRLGGVRRDVTFTLIPFSAVGTESGMLLAFRADYALIRGKRENGALIAVTRGEIGEGRGYSALVHAG